MGVVNSHIPSRLAYVLKTTDVSMLEADQNIKCGYWSIIIHTILQLSLVACKIVFTSRHPALTLAWVLLLAPASGAPMASAYQRTLSMELGMVSEEIEQATSWIDLWAILYFHPRAIFSFWSCGTISSRAIFVPCYQIIYSIDGHLWNPQIYLHLVVISYSRSSWFSFSSRSYSASIVFLVQLRINTWQCVHVLEVMQEGRQVPLKS